MNDPPKNSKDSSNPKARQTAKVASQAVLIHGVDYYIENGRWVFMAKYHLDRGHCCGSGCRHCPYKKE